MLQVQSSLNEAAAAASDLEQSDPAGAAGSRAAVRRIPLYSVVRQAGAATLRPPLRLLTLPRHSKRANPSS
eukprot:SAG11_NODE_20987_length_434_cov_1.065672_1_plen_70_part_10